MTKRGIQNTGEWAPIMEWLDELSGGRMVIPLGKRPPIIRNEDGTLSVTNPAGTEKAQIGDYVFLDAVQGTFHVLPNDMVRRLRDTANGSPELRRGDNRGKSRGNGRNGRNGRKRRS